MTIAIGTTWERGIDYIDEGEVVDARGRVLRLRVLIQRRWGWPRASADMAAEVLRELSRGAPVRLWVSNPERGIQQATLLRTPELLDLLCSGLARGSSREQWSAEHLVSVLKVHFNRPVEDLAMLSEIMEAIAARLGVTVDALRHRWSTVLVDDKHVLVSVDADGLGAAPEADRA